MRLIDTVVPMVTNFFTKYFFLWIDSFSALSILLVLSCLDGTGTYFYLNEKIDLFEKMGKPISYDRSQNVDLPP